MAENTQSQFKCLGDCLSCRAVNERKTQWQYCAAQFSYNALRTMQAMQESVSLMSGEIKELKERIDAIQNSEAMAFTSDSKEETSGVPIGEIAQSGDGA